MESQEASFSPFLHFLSFPSGLPPSHRPDFLGKLPQP
jgi:hypothetical protein